MRLIRLTPERKLALLLALMSVLIIPTALLSPMGGDQGVFSLIGKLIGDGALPYRDIWDIKGPLVYYLYALGQLVTPQKMLGTLCLDVGLFALAFYNLYRLVAPKGQTATALLAGIIMLAGGSFDYLRAGQPDSWCGYLCVILACQLAQLTPHRLTRTAILCGLAIGLMCLIKPTYALLIGAVAVVFYYSSPSLRTLLKPATAFSVAFLAPVLGMIGYLFACEAGDSVVQIGLSYLAAHRYAYDLTFFSYAFIFFSGPTGLSLLMLILGSVYGLVLMARAEKKQALSFAAISLALLLAYLVQAKHMIYQLTPLLLVCSLPAAYVLTDQSRFGEKGSIARFFINSLLSFALLLLGLSYYQPFLRIIPECLGDATSPACLDNFTQEKFSASQHYEMAEVISHHSTAQDKLFIWGYDAGLYLQANRKPASRFIYSYPLLIAPAQNIPILLDDLEKNTPALVVIQKTDSNPVTDPKPLAQALKEGWRSSAQTLQDSPALSAYIQKNYRPLYENEAYILLHKR